jgi:regulator of CtrA degradation
MMDKPMSNEKSAATHADSEPIAFSRHLIDSDAFKAMFREGMGLVEEAATYLDRQGREESRGLNRAGSLAYATESMRLTTRLMQLASWLLLQRAVNDGEMTAEQAGQEKARIRLGGLTSSMEGPGWNELPDRLKELIARSVALQEKIRRLDAIDRPPRDIPDNPVGRQLGQIAEAFASKARKAG